MAVICTWYCNTNESDGPRPQCHLPRYSHYHRPLNHPLPSRWTSSPSAWLLICVPMSLSCNRQYGLSCGWCVWHQWHLDCCNRRHCTRIQAEQTSMLSSHRLARKETRHSVSHLRWSERNRTMRTQPRSESRHQRSPRIKSTGTLSPSSPCPTPHRRVSPTKPFSKNPFLSRPTSWA